jgi:flagellar basal body rod protein FlgF
MARRKKPAGRLNKGPFDFNDLDRAIRADGWFSVTGTKHEAYKHPTKTGKVNLDKKWTVA